MFWNDIKEIKNWMITISSKLTAMQMKFLENKDKEGCCCLEDIETRLSEILQTCESAEQEIPRLASLVNPDGIIDKYNAHIERIEEMMLEFKGCVSMGRAAIGERKEMDELKTILKNMIETCQKYYLCQKNISDKMSKLDEIYKAVCEKPKKKHKPTKKVASTSS